MIDTIKTDPKMTFARRAKKDLRPNRQTIWTDLDGFIQTIDESLADGMSHHSKIEIRINKTESVFLNRKE